MIATAGRQRRLEVVLKGGEADARQLLSVCMNTDARRLAQMPQGAGRRLDVVGEAGPGAYRRRSRSQKRRRPERALAPRPAFSMLCDEEWAQFGIGCDGAGGSCSSSWGCSAFFRRVLRAFLAAAER